MITDSNMGKKKKKSIEIKKVRSAIVNLKDFDYLSKDYDYMEVVEWPNGEGVTIDNNGEVMHMTYGQLKALNKIMKKLNKEE